MAFTTSFAPATSCTKRYVKKTIRKVEIIKKKKDIYINCCFRGASSDLCFLTITQLSSPWILNRYKIRHIDSDSVPLLKKIKKKATRTHIGSSVPYFSRHYWPIEALLAAAALERWSRRFSPAEPQAPRDFRSVPRPASQKWLRFLPLTMQKSNLPRSPPPASELYYRLIHF